jgi:hypothetical protein
MKIPHEILIFKFPVDIKILIANTKNSKERFRIPYIILSKVSLD